MPRKNGKNVGQNGKNVGQNGKDTFGKAQCYNTVENWDKKHVLSVYGHPNYLDYARLLREK